MYSFDATSHSGLHLVGRRLEIKLPSCTGRYETASSRALSKLIEVEMTYADIRQGHPLPYCGSAAFAGNTKNLARRTSGPASSGMDFMDFN
ncbi:hypothetical protein E1B28_012556 [Marasmius oreades]|uniref:Uncharacterized protein n=1 Tax=Marasmius oreades TaxID=181124 RepID=A0A9P7UND0_9AGAR|nr:uncharacterized protein E1B28_012556 [Marasmius oreades]KAG7088577.1 hypothetical protein E1B28_012556 [Marasmius oreades]